MIFKKKYKYIQYQISNQIISNYVRSLVSDKKKPGIRSPPAPVCSPREHRIINVRGTVSGSEYRLQI